MPLWLVFHPPNTFDTQDAKQALANDITKIYTSAGLPAFYVTVQFILSPTSSCFVGGKPETERPFIRISVDHIAVHSNNDTGMHARITARVDAALKPHLADKGYDWEYHIDETARGLWKINGLVPPPYKSEAEQLWASANKASVWEKGRL
ncbi:uncharacterized protein N7458_004680 [Penicillium daleae]|uniref:Tautomerase cis-CaaD-like domain-containing protein n=1 Tax=Penicillium daleae TaxID=63821 RepID=A0AAD6C8U4_9EURO|nr:uncharacterized protein N7458_004680 [Penicillium daleae]KAJ5453724.1 hypothetical protein N7458_004680 [Penicillium daleae]